MEAKEEALFRELKEVHYNWSEKFNKVLVWRRAFTEIIRVLFMQGLASQFKEFGLHLKNSKELLKTLGGRIIKFGFKIILNGVWRTD